MAYIHTSWGEKRHELKKQLGNVLLTHQLKTHSLWQVQQKFGYRYISSPESCLINDLEGSQEEIGKFHPMG